MVTVSFISPPFLMEEHRACGEEPLWPKVPSRRGPSVQTGTRGGGQFHRFTRAMRSLDGLEWSGDCARCLVASRRLPSVGQPSWNPKLDDRPCLRRAIEPEPASQSLC